MLTAEQNALITQTGPGTPGGKLFRCYWQPVALSEELPPDGAPIPVRVLGEDLVLFRGEDGLPGLLGLRCSHRGTDLSYGRVEDGGLRCLYHGWLYDARGRCLDQPGEPAGSTFCQRIRHTAYPCREMGGMILAYLGPGEPPLVPAYPFLHVPEGHVSVTKIFQECNYLQANEGNQDPVHLSFLHRINMDAVDYNLLQVDTQPRVEIEETSWGIRIYAIRDMGEGRHYVRLTNPVFPNLTAFRGPE